MNTRDLFSESGARFSPCGTWRYDLWRRWANGPIILWLLPGPRTADEHVNDPTIDRYQRHSRTLGAGCCYVCDVFTLRPPDFRRL